MAPAGQSVVGAERITLPYIEGRAGLFMLIVSA